MPLNKNCYFPLLYQCHLRYLKSWQSHRQHLASPDMSSLNSRGICPDLHIRIGAEAVKLLSTVDILEENHKREHSSTKLSESWTMETSYFMFLPSNQCLLLTHLQICSLQPCAKSRVLSYWFYLVLWDLTSCMSLKSLRIPVRKLWKTLLGKLPAHSVVHTQCDIGVHHLWLINFSYKILPIICLSTLHTSAHQPIRKLFDVFSVTSATLSICVEHLWTLHQSLWSIISKLIP